MTLAQILPFAATVSMAGLLASVALETDPGSIVHLLRRPSLLVRSVLAMNFIMPLFAVTLALVVDFPRPVQVALIAMALSPVPPMLPVQHLKAGGRRSYTMGLLFVSALGSIVFVPAAAALLEHLFDVDLEVTPGAVAQVVATWMLFPLLLGSAIHALWPGRARQLAKALAWVSNAVVLLILVLLVAGAWRELLDLVGHFSLVMIAVFVLAGLAFGHLLGGPDPQDRTVLALSTATRHPAVALVILHKVRNPEADAAAVVLVLLLGVLLSAPYIRWRARLHAAGAASGA
jgi:BASS family bile acid:Na+ symporter